MSTLRRTGRHHRPEQPNRASISTANSSHRPPVSPPQQAIRKPSHPHKAHPSPSALPIPQITRREAIDIWSNAILLATHSETFESLIEHRSLLRVCGNAVPRSLLYFNVGTLWSAIGGAGSKRYSTKSYAKSCHEDPALAIAWFCLGINQFTAANYPAALGAFEKCITCYTEHERTKNYESQGLDFKLEKTKVAWNIYLSRHRLALQEGWESHLVLDRPLNKIHRHLYFNAPEIGDEDPGGSFISSFIGSSTGINSRKRKRKSGLDRIKTRLKRLRTSLRGDEDYNVRPDSGLGEDTTSDHRRSRRSNHSQRG